MQADLQARTLVLIALVVVSLGAGIASGQGAPSSYYGSAVTADGTELPDGTVIVAVVDGTVQDQITVSDGTYGGNDPLDEKLRVSDTSGTVHFYVETDDGSRIAANRTDEDPEPGTQRFPLSFPNGAGSSESNFDIEAVQPGAATVLENETLTVSADITNRVAGGTETIALQVDGDTRATRSVTLDTGESRTVEFTVDPATLGGGEHTYGVTTANSEWASTLTVETLHPTFAVSELVPNDHTVDEAATFDVSATITNEGNERGTQTVSLSVDETQIDERTVRLDPGANARVTFADINSTQFESGGHTYAVTTANDSQRGTLTIEGTAPPRFTITELSPSSPTVSNDTDVELTATIENIGTTNGTQRARLRIDGTGDDRTPVTLAAGERTTVAFTVDTASLDPGSHSYAFTTENDSRRGTLTVEGPKPPTFGVSDLRPESETVANNASVEVTALLANSGASAGTQRVRLLVDDERFFSRSVTLDSGESRTVAFTVGATLLDPGDHVYAFVTENDSQRESLTVVRDVTSSETTATTTTQGNRKPETATARPARETTETPMETRTEPPTETATEATGTTLDRPGTTTKTTNETDVTPPAETPTMTVKQSTTVASTTDGTAATGGGVLDLLGTIGLTLGGLVVVVYTILKALAIYLGY